MKPRSITIMTLFAAAAALPFGGATALEPGFEYISALDFTQISRDASHAYYAKRYEDAFKLFQRGACAGDKESQSALGRMYLLGQGVERDDLTGLAWLKVAAEENFANQKTLFATYEKAMTDEQRRIADARAAELLAEYGKRATGMSCRTFIPKGTHIPNGILCLPRPNGTSQVEVKRCVAGVPH